MPKRFIHCIYPRLFVFGAWPNTTGLLHRSQWRCGAPEKEAGRYRAPTSKNTSRARCLVRSGRAIVYSRIPVQPGERRCQIRHSKASHARPAISKPIRRAALALSHTDRTDGRFQTKKKDGRNEVKLQRPSGLRDSVSYRLRSNQECEHTRSRVICRAVNWYENFSTWVWRPTIPLRLYFVFFGRRLSSELDCLQCGWRGNCIYRLVLENATAAKFLAHL